jgi:hypothetical protein
MVQTRLFVLTVTLVITSIFATVIGANAQGPANDDFQRTWERTDKPVADLTVSRTWMWGPSANTGHTTEVYANSPGGTRTVQYFDKSRMEINNPNAPRGLWYVTNGLLVTEMITGQMQVGDTVFTPHAPASIPVAGDADDTSGPTYGAMAKVLAAAPLPEGTEISWRINSQGDVSTEHPLTGHGVTAAYYDSQTKHTVASPFWTFMNASGIVWENGKNVNAKLFENPFYATGRPITEAYWAIVKVGGTEQSVLMQCFERRCLTYTPRNADGWKVEAGNVGQHYYAWRYGSASHAVSIFLVSEGDGGTTGIPIGCNDSLVEIKRPVPAHDDEVTAALEALFAIKTRNFGESGLTTALHNSNLTVDSVHYTSSTVTVALSGQFSIGGTCDAPRFVEQITQTVLSASGANSADISVNGIPLNELFNMQG